MGSLVTFAAALNCKFAGFRFLGCSTELPPISQCRHGLLPRTSRAGLVQRWRWPARRLGAAFARVLRLQWGAIDTACSAGPRVCALADGMLFEAATVEGLEIPWRGDNLKRSSDTRQHAIRLSEMSVAYLTLCIRSHSVDVRAQLTLVKGPIMFDFSIAPISALQIKYGQPCEV